MMDKKQYTRVSQKYLILFYFSSYNKSSLAFK